MTHFDKFQKYLDKIQAIKKEADSQIASIIDGEVVPYMKENYESIYTEGVNQGRSYDWNPLQSIYDISFQMDIPERNYLWIPSSWESC